MDLLQSTIVTYIFLLLKFMVKNGTTPSFMSDIFVRNNNANCISANTRSHSEFYNYINPTTTNYGIKTLRHFGPILWNMLPEIIKSATSVKLFKSKIKNWVLFPCPCWLCGNFMITPVFILYISLLLVIFLG